jgi:hypothetical protein
MMAFGGGGGGAPPAPLSSSVPLKTDTEIQTEAAKARARLRAQKGRQATYLSSGPGINGDATITGQQAVQRPTLLGGGG